MKYKRFIESPSTLISFFTQSCNSDHLPAYACQSATLWRNAYRHKFTSPTSLRKRLDGCKNNGWQPGIDVSASLINAALASLGPCDPFQWRTSFATSNEKRIMSSFVASLSRDTALVQPSLTLGLTEECSWVGGPDWWATDVQQSKRNKHSTSLFFW